LSGQLSDQLSGEPWYNAIYWRWIAGWYAGGAALGVNFPTDRLSLFTDFARRIPLIVPYKGMACVSQNPVRIGWLNRRIHCDGGPAVEFADGWSHYALHGVPVPKWLACDSAESLDPLKILAEPNAEVRREGVRKIGVERLVYKAKARRIDATGSYELLEVPIGNNRTGLALKMLNPSVPELWHVEWVHHTCTTVQKALNFRNSLTDQQIDDENGAEWLQQGDVILRPRGAKTFKSQPTILT
jgi:hypothetical protein